MRIQIPVSFVRSNNDIGIYQYNGLRIKLLNNGPMRVDYFPKTNAVVLISKVELLLHEFISVSIFRRYLTKYEQLMNLLINAY